MVDNFTPNDISFMKEALRLAMKGMSWTNPHPMVGAVIVKDGKVIGKGYHHRFGADHAEMDALKHTTQATKGATMYVTLEPCHLPYDLHGSRIPCTEILLQAGIKHLHMAMLDSNPEVAGRGRAVLERERIKTTLGLLENIALKLNEPYHHFMTKGRPFITCTFSASLDGKIATSTGESKWITNKKARNFSQSLRGIYQSILVGINTVIKDNPHLGLRVKSKKDPLRIILDSKLKIPLTSQVLRDNNLIIATTINCDKEKKRILEERGVNTLEFKDDSVPIKGLLEQLYRANIISILVEGGGEVIGSFVDSKMINKIFAFQAPMIIGGKNAVSSVKGKGYKSIKDAIKLKQVRYRKFDDNILTIGYV